MEPMSAGLCEGNPGQRTGQRTARLPLIEDGVRPVTVGAVAAVELVDEDSEDRRRSAGSTMTAACAKRVRWPMTWSRP